MGQGHNQAPTWHWIVLATDGQSVAPRGAPMVLTGGEDAVSGGKDLGCDLFQFAFGSL